MQHRIDTVTVNHDPMEVFMYLPDGDGPHPGIVLAMHIPVGHTGIENDTFTMKTAERYAENGLRSRSHLSFTGGRNLTIFRSSGTSFATIGQNSIYKPASIT
ncbi:MAG: hypothetical protein VXZ99_12935 [Pseudomonadota bacterium]|nr:hypothetical protein [Pseudomonadota bacterium]